MSTEDQKGLWGITTMPKVDGVDTATNYANNGGSSWYITSNCKNVELAEDFLQAHLAPAQTSMMQSFRHQVQSPVICRLVNLKFTMSQTNSSTDSQSSPQL